jgi:hypothetical protein
MSQKKSANPQLLHKPHHFAEVEMENSIFDAEEWQS